MSIRRSKDEIQRTVNGIKEHNCKRCGWRLVTAFTEYPLHPAPGQARHLKPYCDECRIRQRWHWSLQVEVDRPKVLSPNPAKVATLMSALFGETYADRPIRKILIVRDPKRS